MPGMIMRTDSKSGIRQSFAQMLVASGVLTSAVQQIDTLPVYMAAFWWVPAQAVYLWWQLRVYS